MQAVAKNSTLGRAHHQKETFLTKRIKRSDKQLHSGICRSPPGCHWPLASTASMQQHSSQHFQALRFPEPDVVILHSTAVNECVQPGFECIAFAVPTNFPDSELSNLNMLQKNKQTNSITKYLSFILYLMLKILFRATLFLWESLNNYSLVTLSAPFSKAFLSCAFSRMKFFLLKRSWNIFLDL